MSVKIESSLPTVLTSLSSPFQSNGTPKISSRIRLLDLQQRLGADDAKNVKWSLKPIHEELRMHGRSSKRRFALFANPEDQQLSSDGRSGFISFYNRHYKREDGTGVVSDRGKNEGDLLWVMGPTVLVASFIFPSLCLRRILASIFEDSLLTDFLILFFTEALFYCGVALFLFLIDRFRRVPPRELASSGNETYIAPPFGYRIFSAAALASSLTIPMVTMGFVWPWTGPAASATLAPYLVGIVVQFAFEQYARRVESPSWPVIPVVFQIYRLHQLNRAAQLVTALSMTVRGAETTPHNSAINSSLGTLLNVLQLLGVICIWSLSSFVMRYFPSSTATLPDGSGS